MQLYLDRYETYQRLADKEKALHSLLEGVKVKDDVYELAGTYGAIGEVEPVYVQILGLLSSDFGLTEEDAVALVSEKSDLTYTKKLQAVISGVPYVETELAPEEPEAAPPVEDLLPEEESLLQENAG